MQMIKTSNLSYYQIGRNSLDYLPAVGMSGMRDFVNIAALLSIVLAAIRSFVARFLFQYSTIRAPSFESHLADLLGNKAHHEDDNGGHKQEYTHIGEPVVGKKRVEVIEQSSQKHDKTDRQKDPHR